MDVPPLAARVAAEVEALHTAFEAWFRGSTDDPGPIDAALHDAFTFVSPQGDVVDGATLRRQVHAARAQRRILIRVEKVAVRWASNDAVLATYEEHHRHTEYETVRLATVLFVRDDTAPNGLSWRHVHETWIVPPPRL